MSLVKKLNSTEVTPRTALFSIVVLVLATAGVLTAVVKLMNGPVSSRETQALDTPVVPVPAVSPSGPAPGVAASLPPGKQYYAVIAARNLFRPTESTVVAPPVTPPPPSPPTPEKKTQVPPLKPFKETGPAAPTFTPPKLAYTGTVEIGEETYALIEHLESHDAQYVRQGGTAFDCTVTEIAALAVTLEYVGTPFTLNLGENKTEPEPTPPSAAGSGNQPPEGAQPPAGGGRPGPNGAPPGEGRRFQGREGGRGNRGDNPENTSSGGG